MKLQKLFEDLTVVINNQQLINKKKPGTMELLAPFGRHYENSNSDIVKFLLDPKETHKCESQFLKLFLQELKIDFVESELSSAIITREHSTDELRRIDILITLKSQIIIIESKIHSGEQEDQLNHYYEFVKKRFKDKKIYLMFLTKYKQDTHTLNEKNKKELEKLEGGFQNITWGYEILSWLRKAQEQIIPSGWKLLDSAITQYIYSLEILTNQTDEDNTMNQAIKTELLNLLQENPKNWDTLLDIVEGKNTILKENNTKLAQVYNILIQEFGDKVVILENQSIVLSHDDLIKKIEKEKIENVGVGIILSFDQQNDYQLTLSFESQDANSLIFSFGLMAHGNINPERQKQVNSYLDEIQTVWENPFVSNDYWYYVIDQNILSLDAESIAKQIKDVYEKIYPHIK